ncbi:hypothetical protein ACTFIW_000108 [Dictyostelium discoideum]
MADLTTSIDHQVMLHKVATIPSLPTVPTTVFRRTRSKLTSIVCGCLFHHKQVWKELSLPNFCQEVIASFNGDITDEQTHISFYCLSFTDIDDSNGLELDDCTILDRSKFIYRHNNIEIDMTYICWHHHLIFLIGSHAKFHIEIIILKQETSIKFVRDKKTKLI